MVFFVGLIIMGIIVRNVFNNIVICMIIGIFSRIVINDGGGINGNFIIDFIVIVV